MSESGAQVADPAKTPTDIAPRVLIVDDERRNVELLKVMLMSEGYTLLTASNGEDAIALLADQQPDLILLDVMMPGMDGYQVAAKIKQNPATNNIPVIMLTALDDRNAKMQGLNAGAEDFLTKPVDRAELCVRVRNLLRLRTYGNKLRVAHEALAVALEEASDARLMAEHANNAKTQFLRAMSHELRTPLNAISGYTEILELGIRGSVNPAQMKDLGRIKRASAYLLRLINDVLTIARLEGARPLHLIAIAVNSVLVEVEGLCILQAKANGLTLTVTECEHEIFATADAERFQQILLNLVTNAIKFTPKGGRIHVACDDSNGVVQVRVKDSGVGVRMLDLERVFEPFVQIDRHLTSETQQGVGLGLSISRELARAMKGDLTVESVEGIGSTFTLMLPIPSDISAAQRPESSTAPASLRLAAAAR